MTQTVFLKAGSHTSEWAWERVDVRGTVRHTMAPVFDSYPSVDGHGSGFEGHHYAGILSLPRTQVRDLRLDWVGSAGMVSLQRVSLKDDVTRRSYALTREADYLLDANRWQPAGGFGDTKVFENQRAMPRVWIASKTIALSPKEILETIHTSRLPDGTEYDPHEVALTETPVAVDSHSDPARGATIQSSTESEIRIRTHSSESGFLVLSNVDYPGWEATIDGASTPIVRTDYALRGVRLPPGDHTVDFVFRSNSFRIGLILSAVSALGLAIVFARGFFTPNPKERL
jgi:hypothetical protein